MTGESCARCGYPLTDGLQPCTRPACIAMRDRTRSRLRELDAVIDMIEGAVDHVAELLPPAAVWPNSCRQRPTPAGPIPLPPERAPGRLAWFVALDEVVRVDAARLRTRLLSEGWPPDAADSVVSDYGCWFASRIVAEVDRVLMEAWWSA